MITAVIAWFTTSKIGRYIAAAAGIALAVFFAALKLISIGKKEAAADYQHAEAKSQEKINAEELGARNAGRDAARRVRLDAASGDHKG